EGMLGEVDGLDFLGIEVEPGEARRGNNEMSGALTDKGRDITSFAMELAAFAAISDFRRFWVGSEAIDFWRWERRKSDGRNIVRRKRDCPRECVTRFGMEVGA